MTKKHSRTLHLLVILCAVYFTSIVANLLVAQTRAVIARDCVEIRYIAGVWMNSQGTRVAYLVKAPNLNDNRNEYRLYVRPTVDHSVGLGTTVYEGEEPTHILWLRDGLHLAMLVPRRRGRSVVTINTKARTLENVLDLDNRIDDFSLNADGSVIAYLASDEGSLRSGSEVHSSVDITDGYRVDFGSTPSNDLPTSSLFVRRRGSDGRWRKAKQMLIEDPLTHERFEHIRSPSDLSMAPSGELIAFKFMTDSALEAWQESPYARSISQQNPYSSIMVILNLRTEQTSLGFKQVYPDSIPLWSADSRSFLINAHSPVGSVWEREDVAANRVSGLDANLFWVDTETGEIDEVFHLVPSHHEGPLLWRADGDIVLHTSPNMVARFRRDNGSWKQVSAISLPQHPRDWFRWLASDGDIVMGVYETLTTPEELFSYQTGAPEITILTNLNPQVHALRFAEVRNIRWTTQEGLDVDGLLFVPPDYKPGVRYPLVIQTKGDQGWFTCDSGFNHDPSFAPQPIANAGLMYLIRTSKTGVNIQNELAKEPKGYPGGIAEAVQQMHIWDSAVQYLNRRGMIDPSKVGIIGFSRTGWHVEFDLFNAKTKYAAATVADNAQYSLSEYWLNPAFAGNEDSMYGGPPYGSTLQNWEKYSISFNLERIHTPILLEEMGYGHRNENPGEMSLNLAVRYEVTQGLRRLGKPFELYYYPNEGHSPDSPRARLASLTRNVDWFRFWLQGYQEPEGAKADQYARWLKLQNLQEEPKSLDLRARP